MTGFTVSTARREGELTVRMTGELDMATAPEVADVLDPLIATDPPRVVVFDLAQVGFIDSSGLALLVGYRNDGSAGDFAVALSHVDSRTRRLLQLTRLDAALEVRETREP